MRFPYEQPTEADSTRIAKIGTSRIILNQYKKLTDQAFQLTEG